MSTMTRASWAFDVAVAALLVLLGCLEAWGPLGEPMGQGSPVVSTVGIAAFAALLTQRRARPWVAFGALLVWPVLSSLQAGQLQVLFFGQLVPVMVLVYSLARHAQGRLRWISVLGGIAFVTSADLFIPLLRDPSELLFHWGGIVLSYLLGYSLRAATARATAEATRAHEVEAAAQASTLAAIADERARIARELHDIVAHAVGVIVVQAGAAQQVVDDDPEFARRALGTIRETGAGALAEMRRLVTVLREPEPARERAPQPGLAALPALVDAAREVGLEVDLDLPEARPDLPAGLDLTAYRIVQEALTNVRRHSRATRAEVTMAFDDGALEIEVSDAGPLLPGEVPPGHGLVGMRERVGLYGGRVEAGPSGPGFTVRAVLPLERV